MNKRLFTLLSLLVLASMILTACGAANGSAASTPNIATQVELTMGALDQANQPNAGTQVAQTVQARQNGQPAQPTDRPVNTPRATATPNYQATIAAQAVSGTNCTGIENISEPNEFDHVQNHDMGDPFTWWLLFAWDGTDISTWFGTVGEPMLSLDVENDRIVGVEYLVKANSAESVACVARELAKSLGINPYWLYIGKNDLDVPNGFTTDFLTGWNMHTRPYMEAPIKDGNDWIVNGEQFSPSSSNRTFGHANAYTLIQSWNTSVGYNPAQHVLVSPGYEATFSKPYQGAIFKTVITVSLRRYFERALQMVTEVIFRDSTAEEVTMVVYTSHCGPVNGDRPQSWDDPLPAGVTCSKIP